MVAPDHTAETVLATTGALIGTIPVIPQLWKSYKTKSTNGLSPHLMSIWGICCLFGGIYNVSEDLSLPLQVQPHAFGVLCAISWAQCLCYSEGYKASRALSLLATVLSLSAAFELPSIFALKYAKIQGSPVPVQFFGYMYTVLTIVGLIPQYYEIWRCKEVRGISLTFMGLSILSSVLNILSLFFRRDLPIPPLISYLVYGGLDGIIVILALILNPTAKRLRAAEQNPSGRQESGLALTDIPSPQFPTATTIDSRTTTLARTSLDNPRKSTTSNSSQGDPEKVADEESVWKTVHPFRGPEGLGGGRGGGDIDIDGGWQALHSEVNTPATTPGEVLTQPLDDADEDGTSTGYFTAMAKQRRPSIPASTTLGAPFGQMGMTKAT